MKISFIIVNFQSETYLKKCISSIQTKIKSDSYEIIIINNDSKKLSDHSLYSHPSVQIIEVNENKGFATACNMGAKIAIGKYLFFLNPDTELLFANIDDFISILKESKNGAVAPKLITTEGIEQSWGSGSSLNPWSLIRNQFKKSAIQSQKKDIVSIDWVSGAAFMLSKNIFDTCGGFDEKFFMYFEDIDLCRRIKLAGFQILKASQFSVIHIGGQSYSDEKKQKYQYYCSQNYYFKKHFGLLSMLFVILLRSVMLCSKDS